MSNEYKARIDLAAKDSQDFSVVAEIVRDRIVNATQLPKDAATNCPRLDCQAATNFSQALEQPCRCVCDREQHLRRNDVLGDRACKFTANSPLLRCAVNPEGPCEGCQHFEKG